MCVSKDDLRKERRNYRKRRIKSSTRGGLLSPGLSTLPSGTPTSASSRGLNWNSDAQSLSSEDEIEGAIGASQSDGDDLESEQEKQQGKFSFRRKLHCNYHAVSLVHTYHWHLIGETF